MTGRDVFEYALVRVVPRIERGEMINAGVLVYCRAKSYVGARVHLNPLVVTFSLMFWGFLWDAAGLLLAIPITAGIKAVCDNVAGLRSFGRFLGD